MSLAKAGDTVKTHYTGKRTDGTVFDSSEGNDPLEFKIGGGNLIKGFEQGVVGMAVGETKTVTIPPQEAYGLKREDLVAEVERKHIPENIDLAVDKRLQASQPDGRALDLLITDVGETTVTLDANHPLAGETLVFDIQLVGIA